ncbi:MAG: DUF2147 domain-containing protein [Parvibaculum sp.]|nr:DUF2147 domain-containing protein [Parvibaculum sp.]
MTFRILGAALLFSAALALPASADTSSPAGQWRIYHPLTNEPFMIVEIEVENSELEGQIVGLADGPRDAICWSCIGENRNKPLAGMEFIKNGKWDGRGWTAVMMRPATGMVSPAYFALEADGEVLHMTTGRGPLQVDQRWQRIK